MHSNKFAGIKTPYDFKDLGYVTGIKYLDQVEDMVKANYRREKESSWGLFGNSDDDETEPVAGNGTTNEVSPKENFAADYTLANEFIDNPRRVSRDDSLLPPEILELEIVHEDERLEGKEYMSRLEAIAKKPYNNKDNSTTLLERISFCSKIKSEFARNRITYDQDKNKMIKQELKMAIENAYSIDLLNMNLNKLSEKDNSMMIQAFNEVDNTYKSLVQRYTEVLRKEKAVAAKKLLFKRRKVKSLDGKFYPAGLYLKKMKKGNRILSGLGLKEVRGGPRIAVINAVGGIGSGKSGNGVNGRSLGSDTLISQVGEYLAFIR